MAQVHGIHLNWNKKYKTDAQKLARNIVKREQKYKTHLKDGTPIPREMINEATDRDMAINYASMYNKMVPESKRNAPKEASQYGKSQRTEEGKKKVSKSTVEFLKEQEQFKSEVSQMPTYDEFILMDSKEQSQVYLKMKNLERHYDVTKPSQKKFKADMEVARARLLNSSKVPLEVRRYLAKADLNTIYDYLLFMDNSKNRVANAEDSFYQEMMMEYYDQEQMAASANTTDKKIFFNFLKFQIRDRSRDGEMAKKIIRKASQLKVRGKQVFTYEDLEGYI